MSKTRRIEFLERLANLLQEYNAEIAFKWIETSGERLIINVHDEKVFESNDLYFDGKDVKNYVKQIKDA